MSAACHHCALSSPQLLHCSACQTTVYCSKTCQVEDWPVHKIGCGRGVVISPEGAKGKGIRATRAHAKGALILTEQPVIVFPHDVDAHVLEAHLRSSESPLARLKPATLKALLALHDNQASSPTDKTLIGIIETNGLPHGEDGSEGGLFLFLSRLNHSCAPNCARSWNSETEREELLALVDIHEGDELTSAYFDILDDTAHRREYLQTYFGFQCMCAACENPGDEGWKRLVKTYDDAIQQCLENREFAKVVTLADKRLAELRRRQWNNPGDLSRTCFDAAMACTQAGKHKQAVKYLDEAIKLSNQVGMGKHVDVLRMIRMRQELL